MPWHESALSWRLVKNRRRRHRLVLPARSRFCFRISKAAPCAGSAAALARHDALMRAAMAARGAYVFKTMGDAFCTAFAASKCWSRSFWEKPSSAETSAVTA